MHIYDVLAVFMLFVFTLIFFRANNSEDLSVLLNSAFFGTLSDLMNPVKAVNSMMTIFSSSRHMIILMSSVCLLFLVDFLLKKQDLDEYLKGRPTFYRWSFYFVITAWIFLFGAFSRPENFVYFQF